MLTKLFSLGWRAAISVPARLRMQRCGRLLLSGGYHISGHKFISIGSLYAGSGLWLDALSSYGPYRFAPQIQIGDNVRLSSFVHIGCTNSIVIGNNVVIGSHVLIIDHDHGVYAGENPHSSPESLPHQRTLTSDGFVRIEDNVFIGEYVAVLKNVVIGEGSVVGAHSVVARNVPPETVVAGNPARIVKVFDRTQGQWLSARASGRLQPD